MSVAAHADAPPRSAGLPPLVGVAAFALFVAALFGPTFVRLVDLWEKDPNYSHGYLVAPIAAYLAWMVYRQAGAPRGGDRRLATIGAVLGVFVHLVAVLIVWPPLDFLALVLILRSGLVAAGGREWAAKFTFPLLFLFFMFPIPVTWTSYAALWLQDIVSRVSYEVIQLFVVAGRRGHTIYIAGVPEALVVAEECSGLRQIVSFLAFGALLGHLTRRPVGYQILITLMAVPVAVVTNVLRVSLMNLGAAWFGAEWLDGPLHHAPALFTIPVGLVLYLVVNRVLGTAWNYFRPEPPAAAEEPPPADAPADPELGRRLLVTAAFLGAGLSLQFLMLNHLHAAGPSSFPELKGPLAGVPESVPGRTAGTGWGSREVDKLAEFRAKLPFQVDDLYYRDFGGQGVPWARVYMVYSKSGDDRKHHPEICIRDVSGAPERIADRTRVSLVGTGDDSRQAARFAFETRPGEVLTVYYWHYTLTPREESLRSPLQRVHSRIGVPAPSVTVQVYTNTPTAADRAAIEQVFLPALDKALVEKVMPDGTDVGCHRLPVGLVRE
jgi:exosortase